jgi:hypothetical protein
MVVGAFVVEAAVGVAFDAAVEVNVEGASVVGAAVDAAVDAMVEGASVVGAAVETTVVGTAVDGA